MELKTKINAEDGKQELTITREFDLPVELLFRAHTEAGLIEQWMGNKVLKLDNKNHGGYQYEVRDAKGNVVFRCNGSIHEFVPNERITRTFEMENTPFPIQLEFLQFEKLTEDTSRINIHTIFKSVAHRDQVLKLPFAQGINMAHNKLQEFVNTLK